MSCSVDYTIKTGTNSPLLLATLKNADQTPVDLSGATVKIKWRRDYTTTTNEGTCTIVSPTAGSVSFQFTGLQTSTPGEFEFEFEVTWGSLVERIPTIGVLRGKFEASV